MAMCPMNAECGNRIGLAILAKAPVPGLAKTRLIPHLGAEGAAALQRWLLQRIMRLVKRIGQDRKSVV